MHETIPSVYKLTFFFFFFSFVESFFESSDKLCSRSIMCAAVDSAASSSSETSPTSETKSSDIELFFNFFPLIMILCFSCSGLKKHIYYDVRKL